MDTESAVGTRPWAQAGVLACYNSVLVGEWMVDVVGNELEEMSARGYLPNSVLSFLGYLFLVFWPKSARVPFFCTPTPHLIRREELGRSGKRTSV